MKILHALLAGSMLLAFAPLAVAGEAGDTCAAPPDEGIAHPLKERTYLFLDASKGADKVGEWTERNGAPGLQTTKCFHLGVYRLSADLKADLLP